MTFKADAAKIKRWREERHWSQEHLSELAGLGLRTIQRIENGEKASQESILALAAAFNVDAMALSVNIEKEAERAADLIAKEATASMRLTFYYHVASFVVVLTLFGFLALIDGNLEIFKITLWFALPLTIHGVLVFIAPLAEQHERKFGKK